MRDAALVIRPIRAEDEPAWRVLWSGYLTYYETTLSEEIYRTTFARLLAGGPGEFRGFLALRDGIPVGLVHYLFHPSSWRAEGTCYLQDLFTAPQARGAGVARALIEAVYGAADAEGVPSVYWFTQDFNATARRLYDRIGVLTPFIRYNRRLAPPRPLPPGVTLHRIEARDEAEWRRLWADYLTFYETTLPPQVTDATFRQIISGDPAQMQGLLARVDGHAAGLVQFVTHRSCWKVEKVCYLQDLYADPAFRGRGLGRALIEAVYAQADLMGTPAVYWLTQNFNATARRLYDRIGLPTPFVEYDRPE
jgi:GNAT superfamily N-acetyltransferase